ncbi:MAG: hypothetical protein HQM00_02280 [Magnetococcales bacterium]|nr:hypothetical protein [Magnetococcales bacterium]
MNPKIPLPHGDPGSGKASEAMSGYTNDLTREIRWFAVPYTRGTGLDMGCGVERLRRDSIGVDVKMVPDGATIIGDFHVAPNLFAENSLDYVFTSRPMSPRILEAVDSFWRVIRVGACLVVYQPEAEAEQWHAAVRQCAVGATLMEDETSQDGQSRFMVWRKESDPGWKEEMAFKRHDKPRALVVRYGGFGDQLQASAVFPGLKAQGYEVWMNTFPIGQEVLKHNPFIDGWLVQDPLQVPNHELREYWQAMERRFAKVVNLSESVEWTTLVQEDRLVFRWPTAARKYLFDTINYQELIHKIADVPGPYDVTFFSTPEEQKWAMRQRREMAGKGPVILWVLSGSAFHKAWPWTADVARSVLDQWPDAVIVTCGHTNCQILEEELPDDPRVVRRSGVWSIRETMAFAQASTIVVGPETGVLNAVGTMETPAKVLMLSHSSRINLAKHWRKTVSLEPDVACFPCHQMHYSKKSCVENQTTFAAECATRISPEAVYHAIERILKNDAKRGDVHGVHADRGSGIDRRTHHRRDANGAKRAGTPPYPAIFPADRHAGSDPGGQP